MRHHFTASRRIGAWQATVLVLLASVLAACDPSHPLASSPLPTQTPGAAPQPTAPTPVPTKEELDTSARLSGVVSEMTANGPVPLAGVEIYCDRCGEFGHMQVTTDADGAYDFGLGGIWLYPRSTQTTILVHKDGYDDPGGSPGSLHWSQRYVTINGDTRFDFRLVRRQVQVGF